ncbi:hypothetical protein OV203_17845 [Nannocystis sp. ILAH1]|uniref:hypothetical protein n=1 Tax=Nannocystis sp. ILAH1 TaxID=2996789 RepID=UPI002271ADB2|nr:hypothetical protein [Nannocystis sp. ILAH1]MCY0989004.1 hypothetical protein [Nannocystis sp. ILAH1]
MLEIQQRLRELFNFPIEEQPFTHLLRHWRLFTSQAVALEWERHGSDYYAWWKDFDIKIESGRARNREMKLRFRWPRGGSRIIGRGELLALQTRAAQICRRGGPHGAPFVTEDEPARPGRPQRRLHLTQFRRTKTHESALAQGFGAGYEARVRPLGADLQGDHALFVVSPTGAFVLVGFGPDYNLTALANFWRGNLTNEFASDLHDGDEPFAVRVRGVPHRLEYVRLPGLAGFVHTPLGEVYLCLLGDDDVALVLVGDDGAAQCLFRGTASQANGHELLPDEVPVVLLERPRPFTPEMVAEAIARQPKLDPAIRDHLAALVRAARDELGTEYARHLVWALVSAHASGRRTPVVGTHTEVFAWVLEQGDMRAPPKERAGRGALHWLAARSPLFERAVVKRIAYWKNHVEWFSEPNTACIARLATRAGQIRVDDLEGQ